MVASRARSARCRRHRDIFAACRAKTGRGQRELGRAGDASGERVTAYCRTGVLGHVHRVATRRARGVGLDDSRRAAHVEHARLPGEPARGSWSSACTRIGWVRRQRVRSASCLAQGCSRRWQGCRDHASVARALHSSRRYGCVLRLHRAAGPSRTARQASDRRRQFSAGRGLAASYEARRYGVRSAMPGFRARALCPNGVFVPPNMARYAEVSEVVHQVFNEFTPEIEPIALDEAFLDITGSERLFGGPLQLATQLKQRVRERTELAVTVAVALTSWSPKSRAPRPSPMACASSPRTKCVRCSIRYRCVGCGASARFWPKSWSAWVSRRWAIWCVTMPANSPANWASGRLNYKRWPQVAIAARRLRARGQIDRRREHVRRERHRPRTW